MKYLLNISASIKQSCIIPTATPKFLRLRNSMKLFLILCDARVNEKSKVAFQ